MSRVGLFAQLLYRLLCLEIYELLQPPFKLTLVCVIFLSFIISAVCAQ